VLPTFYDVLADDTFGYADVTVLDLIEHLQDAYGTITRTDLEANRNRLKEPWNPDQDFANLWTKIKTVRQIATDGADAITNNTTIELTIQALCSAGVYAHAITTWDDKPDAEKTWSIFRPILLSRTKTVFVISLLPLPAFTAHTKLLRCPALRKLLPFPPLHLIPDDVPPASAATIQGTSPAYTSNTI
jgi:hypothetical protein